MSLKEQTKGVYAKFGLDDNDFEIYLVYLGQPQCSVSECAAILEKTIEEVQTVTDKLEESKFIKKVPGVVERYIPQEPYLEMFIKQNGEFRESINVIKDNVLADQSNRFDTLEKIEETTLETISTAISTQVDGFTRDSDNHDLDKREVINGANTRFNDSAKATEADLHKHLDENNEKIRNTVNTQDTTSNAVWDKNTKKFAGDNTQLNSEL